MHDWTLIDIIVLWKEGKIVLNFLTPTGTKEIVVRDFSKFIVPRDHEWGASMSVNGSSGPVSLENGNYLFSVEMQSGDIIEIEAKSIVLPKLV